MALLSLRFGSSCRWGVAPQPVLEEAGLTVQQHLIRSCRCDCVEEKHFWWPLRHTQPLCAEDTTVSAGESVSNFLCGFFFHTEEASSSLPSSSHSEDNMTDPSTNMRLKLPITCFILQIILIILFGVLVQYDEDTDAKKHHHGNHSESKSDIENDFYYRYPSECVVNVHYFGRSHVNFFSYLHHSDDPSILVSRIILFMQKHNIFTWKKSHF